MLHRAAKTHRLLSKAMNADGMYNKSKELNFVYGYNMSVWHIRNMRKTLHIVRSIRRYENNRFYLPMIFGNFSTSFDVFDVCKYLRYLTRGGKHTTQQYKLLLSITRREQVQTFKRHEAEGVES